MEKVNRNQSEIKIEIKIDDWYAWKRWGCNL